ncbi:MAG: sodium:solute symporter family protein, partial [Ruminococcaceae bacterium]|nr:sodium:solute symporter family protein [Oscillospiraceae bacterium]
PQMIHKFYGIKDDREIKRGTIISTVFALVVAGGGYFIGSLSRLFYSELPEAGTDYLVPSMLGEANLSALLLGVVLVLLIAASVSTLCSITITASSTLTIDIVKQRIAKNMDEKKSAFFMKGVAVVFIVASYFIANTKTPILDMMSYSWGVISGSFLAPYALLLYSDRLTKKGASIGMIGGFITALPPVVCKLFFPEAALPFFGKVCDLGPHFACLAMVVSFALCLCFGKVFDKSAKSAEFIKA